MEDDREEYEGGDCDCGDDECPVCNTDCHYCHGEGFGFSDEWDMDPLWVAPGTVVKCPCCGGSGKSKDCTFW